MVEYAFERAQGAYIASICSPDLTYCFAVCAQVVTADTIFNGKLNKAIKNAKDDPDFGLKFVLLHSDSLRIVAFADASFECNKDQTSQLGFDVCLANKDVNANIVHYISF